MNHQLFSSPLVNNHFNRRTIPVSQHPNYAVYGNQPQRQMMFTHNRVVSNSGHQAYTYQRHVMAQPILMERPRQALSFIPAPVALPQQYSFIPPRPQPEKAFSQAPPPVNGLNSQALFSRVGSKVPARPLMQNFSYVPPPTRSMEEPVAKPEKSLDLNWLGICISESGEIEIHGTKENIEELRLHAKFNDVPAKFIDINAPVAISATTQEDLSKPRKSLEELPKLPVKKRLLFIDPEGVLAKGVTNDFGLNEEAVRSLVILAGLLGPSTQFSLACGSAYRENGVADRYSQGLLAAGLPLAVMTEPKHVNTGLKLVGPDAVDKSIYISKQMKADRCAEISHYISRHPDADFVMIQAWGGSEQFGIVSPMLDDASMQPHLVQCNESLDTGSIYRYFESIA